MSADELRVYEADIRRAIDAFLPKRRKSLLEELERRLSAKGPIPSPPSPRSVTHSLPTLAVDNLARELRAGLADLSQYHIFLWSTYYREFLSGLFADGLRLAQESTALAPLAAAVRAEIATHAAEIFTKGFKYVTETKSGPQSVAVGKSLGGLQRFLELPIEFYSTRVSTTTTLRAGRALRTLCSAMLAGILRGYASVTLGTHSGKQLLSQNARLWAHYIAFLTEEDFGQVFADLQHDSLTELETVAPVVQALDRLLDAEISLPALPVLTQLQWDQRRLDVSLRIHVEADLSHLLEVQIFLNADFVVPAAAKEAAARGASLLLMPRHSAHDEQPAPEPTAGVQVLYIDPSRSAGDVARHVYDYLELAIFARKKQKLASDPLTFNFAREFPLFNPLLAKFFHVYRTSVRDLLRTFERRNGVRLWCSVRRSGKTVACFDLGDSAGPSTVASQTFATIHPLPNSTLFKELVDAALSSGSDIGKGFFTEAVKQCAPAAPPESARFVFVLDEYERLFEKLESIAASHPEVEHRVVLPLLDQMAAFARDNLLVFIGQQPDAHYILMAHNQLSAYVQQDSFPLFTHSGMTGEFAELLRKVFRQVADFDQSFADALFEETAGHPFLTVSLLVAFVQSLIEESRALGDLRFSADDFDRFAVNHLRSDQLGLRPEYDFFNRAISEAIGPLGRERNPWLHVVYRSLQRVAQESQSLFRVSLSDFRRICLELRTHELGFSADRVISTAAQSNFLDLGADEVRVKIPLLGRLAGIARERVRP